MDKQEFRALAEEVARHLRRLRGEDWNVVVEYDNPAAAPPSAELAAAAGGGRLKLGCGSRVPGKVTVTGMFPEGYGHSDWRANVDPGRGALVIAKEASRRLLKAGYLAELTEVYKRKAADDALAARQDAWLAAAAALFGREAPGRSPAGTLRLRLDDYVAGRGHAEPYDTPDGGRWSVSLSGVPAETLLRMLAVLAQDCAARPAAAACRGGQLDWPAVAADPARSPAGQCEFCRAPGVPLVAVLTADPDQQVCAECHADPRLPTQAAPAAGVPAVITGQPRPLDAGDLELALQFLGLGLLGATPGQTATALLAVLDRMHAPAAQGGLLALCCLRYGPGHDPALEARGCLATGSQA